MKNPRVLFEVGGRVLRKEDGQKGTIIAVRRISLDVIFDDENLSKVVMRSNVIAQNHEKPMEKRSAKDAFVELQEVMRDVPISVGFHNLPSKLISQMDALTNAIKIYKS